MKHPPSKYQQAIYDFVTGKYELLDLPSYIDLLKPINLVVGAVAGSGKSTTLLELLALIPREHQVLFLAFNKSIIEELTEKVPKDFYNVQVKTLHSFGMSVINANVRKPIMDKEGRKYKDILDNELRYNGKGISFESPQQENDYRGRVLKLVDLGRMSLANSADELEMIATRYDIELTDGECNFAFDCMQRGKQMPELFDFTDMIWLPVALKMRAKKYKKVLIDECQDLSPCQQALMLMAVDPNGGSWIAVGDRAQAIYFFSGASSSSFDVLVNQPNTIELPLSVCYRCDLARKYVPGIEARPGAGEGLVDYESKLEYIRSGDMVMCRNTFPLIVLCMKFLAENKKAYLVGKDISKGLVNMIKPFEGKSFDAMNNHFVRELTKIKRKLMIHEGIDDLEAMEHQQYVMYQEKIDIIDLFCKDMRTIKDVIFRIESIFKEKKESGIQLCTIHKAKGLEADRAFIIHEELMPSKASMKNPETRKQEYNLIYVAYTRPRHEIHFVQDFNAYKNKKAA